MLRRIITAALTAIAWFYIIVFIKMGTVWFFNLRGMIELPFIFLFMLSSFWVHEKIALLFTSARLDWLPNWAKRLLEGAAVFATAMLLCCLFVFVPASLLIPTAKFPAQDLRLWLVFTAFLFLFFYYFVERERVQKKLQLEFLRAEQLQKESFQAQLEALKNQVNPHFLFNSLNVLGSLIYKDQDQAVTFLHRLSGVYRSVLTHSDRLTVPLRAELELADAYIYLMKTRFGDTLDFQIDVPADKQVCEVPPAVLQLLIENAIKHNGATTNKPLRVRICVDQDQLVVENNRQPRLDAAPSTGLGLQNIINRYEHLTPKPVQIVPTDETFTVRLPLLSASPTV
ncbi:histidine kinase [Hymenobacter qilianensis]|uniref:Histidine kinase n=2 Tax=Hymenobacter qilianensis TaxID=1385715 RepID=A0A7H0GVD0_9BACT|nr:histidine kinase [Hymenobacter qilianensis]QNP52246.1 histidine kinase [Hymenobacter qilianensis]GGF65817.1 histidine kinase [Hymenobacter qilianensis]